MEVKDAFEILHKEGIANNEQTLRRWIREGKLKATMRGTNRNSGYEIQEDDLEEFLLSKLPPVRLEEYKLRKQTDDLHEDVKKHQEEYIKNISQTVLSQFVQEFKKDKYEEAIETIFNNGDGMKFVDALIKKSVETTVKVLEERRNTNALLQALNKWKEGE